MAIYALCFEKQESFVQYYFEGDILFLFINISIIVFSSVILKKIKIHRLSTIPE